jgi:hypothetical protein
MVALEDDHLAVVIQSDVGPRFCRQHGKTLDAVGGILPEDPRDTEPISPGERESPFVLSLLLRIGGRGEFEEMGRGNQAPCAFPKATLLGSKIENRLLVGGAWRPYPLRQFGAITGVEDDRRGVTDSNVIARS